MVIYTFQKWLNMIVIIVKRIVSIYLCYIFKSVRHWNCFIIFKYNGYSCFQLTYSRTINKQKTSEVQFYNENFLILQFTLITCDIFNSQFTSFDRINCLLIKHYKCDALSWADTNGALGFDWRKVLYTDVANTYDRMTYQPPRTSW